MNDGSKRNRERKLIEACAIGKLRDAKLLVNSGVNPNCRDAGGWTPLIWACQEGNLSLTRLLLGAGANVNVQDLDGTTPLRQALASRRPGALVKLLIEHGANVNKAKSRTRSTPMHTMSAYGFHSQLMLLIQAGARIDAKDALGRTPLFLAVLHGHVRAAKLLLKHGALVDLTSVDPEERKTLLQLRASKKLPELRAALESAAAKQGFRPAARGSNSAKISRSQRRRP